MDAGEELLGFAVNDALSRKDGTQELLSFFVSSVREEYERKEGASGVYYSHDVPGIDNAMTLYALMKAEFPEQLVRIGGRKDREPVWIEVAELLGLNESLESVSNSTWDTVEEDWKFARQFLSIPAFLDAWRSGPIADFEEALSTCDLLYSKYESDGVAFVLRQHASSWTVAVRRPIEKPEPGT